jgi:hypothetical protein
MKTKIISSFVLFFIFIGILSAQVSLDQIIVSEGKGAITSGLDFVISLSKPNGVLFGAQANNERSNLRFGKKFGNSTMFVTVGAFKNVPWIGPMFTYNYKFIDLFSWSGFAMAANKEYTDAGWHPAFLFNYEEMGFTLGKNRLAYSISWFMRAKVENFIICRREIPLGGEHDFFIETTYNLSKDLPMFVLGYKYSFVKNK